MTADSQLEGARAAVEARIGAIDERLSEVAQLQAERERLQEALKLLGGANVRARRRPSAAAGEKPGRGNRDAVLSFLAANPDVEAGAVVAALGINRGVAYNLLGRLVKQGVVERAEGPNARARYRVAAPAG